MFKKERLTGFVLFCCFFTANAYAGPITFDFTGVATTRTGVFAGLDTAVTGSYTYDDTVVDTNAGLGQNSFGSHANNVFPKTYSITVRLGTETRTRTTSSATGGFVLKVLDNNHPSDTTPNPDRYEVGFYEFSLGLNGTADDAIVWTDNLVPTSAPNLSKFDTSINNGIYKEGIAGTAGRSVLFYKLSTITKRTNVPEPGTLALLGIGLAGFGFSRRRKA